MFEALLIGGGFAFAAALQPGPFQAFLFSRVAQHGWKRTLPAAFAPLLSDGPIAVIALLLLTQVPPGMTRVLRAAGGILLLYLAWRSYQQGKQASDPAHEGEGSPPSTFFQAALINLLNPNPYLAWSLVLGPAVMTAWQERPLHGIALILAFYVTMIALLLGLIILFGTTRFLNPRLRQGLVFASAGALALLGGYQVTTSLLSMAG
jgi:threonine/homoserine/homoserine lactone efflux protein